MTSETSSARVQSNLVCTSKHHQTFPKTSSDEEQTNLVCSYGDNGEKYVLDKNERWIAVGEVNAQEYPYTWDFTEHNMSDDRFNYWNLFSHTVEANSMVPYVKNGQEGDPGDSFGKENGEFEEESLINPTQPNLWDDNEEE